MSNSPRAARPQRRSVLLHSGAFGSLPDSELLGLFASDRADSGELAFSALVERHGPMVLRTCRAILKDSQDAQDAFQATFLILALKANRLSVPESLGPWLYQVAHRTAKGSRSRRFLRIRHERIAAGANPLLRSESPTDDLASVMHDELARLPDRYRSPLVLCYLQGHTHEQAARCLGWPLGTVESRLARGRSRLRSALTRRGFDPTCLALPITPEILPPALAEAVVSNSLNASIAKLTSSGVISGVVATLTRKVLIAMSMRKFAFAAFVIAPTLALGFAIAGHGQIHGHPAPDSKQVLDPDPGPETQGGSKADGTDQVDLVPKPIPEVTDPRTHESNPEAVQEALMDPTVRIHVGKRGHDSIVSGTIIRSHPGETLILTAAHPLKPDSGMEDGVGAREINVMFGAILRNPMPIPASPTLIYEGTVVDADFPKDLALIRIKPRLILPSALILPESKSIKIGDELIALGCPKGGSIAASRKKVVRLEVGPNGPQGYRSIVCTGPPQPGESGGGLFLDGYLCGVSNYATPEVGFYADLVAIREFLARNGLGPLLNQGERENAEATKDGARTGIAHQPHPLPEIPEPLTAEKTPEARLRAVEVKLDRILNILEGKANSAPLPPLEESRDFQDTPPKLIRRED